MTSRVRATMVLLLVTGCSFGACASPTAVETPETTPEAKAVVPSTESSPSVVAMNEVEQSPLDAAGCDTLQNARMPEASPSSSVRTALLTLVTEGDLWVWADDDEAVRHIPIGDAIDAWPSPDGKVVALLRESDDDAYPGKGMQSIWRIDPDGSGLRQLVSSAALEADLEDTGKLASIYQVQWRPGTQILTWRISPRVVEGLGGPMPTVIRALDVSTGHLGRLGFEDRGWLVWSPDGRWIAVESASGTIEVRNEVGRMQVQAGLDGRCMGMGHGCWQQAPTWSSDALYLASAIVPDASSRRVAELRIGFEVMELGIETGRLRSKGVFMSSLAGIELSSDLRMIATEVENDEGSQRSTGDHRFGMHLQDLDGPWGQEIEKGTFMAWAPAGWRYLFRDRRDNRLMIGQPCSIAVPVEGSPDGHFLGQWLHLGTRESVWLDAERFVFLEHASSRRLLRLGRMDGSSRLLASLPASEDMVMRTNR